MHEVHEKSRNNTNVLFTLLSHKFDKKSNLKHTVTHFSAGAHGFFNL